MKTRKLFFGRAVSALLCVAFLFISTASLLSSVVASADETPEPVIPVVSFLETEVQANGDNLVIFTVVMSHACPDEDVTVTFHTENRSAIAGREYNAVSSSVVIAKGTDEASIAVEARTITPWATVNDKSNQLSTRHFAVILDSVSGGNAELDEDNRVALGYLRANYTLVDHANAGLHYLKEYLDYQTVTHGDVHDIDGGETWKTWKHSMTLDNQTTRSWVTDFINSGLANAYATMLIKDHSYDTNFHTSDSRIIMGNGCYVYLDNCSRDDSGVVAWWTIEPCYNTAGCTLNGYANELFSMGKNPNSNDGQLWDKTGYWGSPERMRINFYNDTEAWYASYGEFTYSTFYRIIPFLGALDVGASFYNSSSWQDNCLKGLYIKMMLKDTTAPTLKSSYLDDSSLATDGVLRLILNFSEPVYVRSDNASVEVHLNGSAVAKYFTYAGGNYSDTLYYEWKADKNTYTSYSFSIEDSTADYIGDLSYQLDENYHLKNLHVAKFTSDTFTLDEPIRYATPDVTFSYDGTNWAKYHEVDVSTGDITSGKLYYLWDQSPDDVRDVAAYGSNCVEFVQPTTTLTFSQVNGSYYLHTLVVTPYGLSAAATSKVQHFDNTAPDATQVLVKNDLKTKIFSLSFHDSAGTESLSGCGGIDKVQLAIDYGYNGDLYTVYDAASGKTDPLFKLRNNSGDYNGTYYCSLTGLDEEGNPTTADPPTYGVDAKITGALYGAKRGSYDMYFILTDTCGNRTVTQKEHVTFDVRDSVNVDVQYGGGLTPDSRIDAMDVYNIGHDESMQITVSTDQTSGHLRLVLSNPDGALPGTLTYLGTPITGDTVDATDGSEKTITLEGLVPGYYEITPYFVLDTVGEEEVLVSPTVSFYVTAGWNDPTANHATCNGNLVLRNNVIQLNTPYYYLSLNGSAPMSHPYGATVDPASGRYTGGSSAPSFSSLAEARDYVTYMEYQDMYLVSINSAQANFLNSGTGSTVYVKADGEKTFAEAGQLWIRYKRDSWTPSSSAYGWVFYYYGEGTLEEGIDIRNLSSTLRNAVYAVRDTVCRAATTAYLVGDEGTAATTGAPSLKPEQIHVAYEEATETRMHTPFVVPVGYAGDGELFVNTVTDSADGVERPLATNLILSVTPSTRLFYHYGIAEDDSEWIPLNAQNGTVLRRALASAAGIYTILECDGNGASEYEIYIDNEPPRLTVKINGEERVVEPGALQYSGTTFSFVSLDGEIDEYAYVAVYSSTWRLLNVYYGNSVGNVSLAESNYYIEVGDRSGNSFVFSLRMAPGALKASAELSSAGNGVLVTVTDRLENEIYRYEVWCNNVLINNEFVARKLYTDPGIYTVFVQDIYGNEFRSKTLTYRRAAPEVAWSYLNSYGTYSAYNPQSIVAMMITPDETSFGRSFVSTSALLRFRLSEDGGTPAYSFEGLEEDDWWTDISGRTVTVNKLSGWTLKVWYEEYPDNYETYVCVVDDEAPAIKVSYIGTPYTCDEREDLTETLSLIPKTLTYKVGDSSILTAQNGALLNSRFITVTAEDHFGVRLLTVTKDGKTPVSAADDGSFRITEYGTYRVTATDLFGNTGVFDFVNTPVPAASFSVDGAKTVPGSLTERLLGNTSVVAELSGDGEAELLLTRNGTAIYRCYKVVDGAVYVGEYSFTETEKGVKDVVLVYSVRPVVTLSVGGAAVGEWYELESGEGYTVSVRFSSDRLASFRVTCEEGKEEIELRVITGASLLPEYRAVTLSRLGTDIPIRAGDKVIPTNRTGEVIYVASPLSVPEITDPDVARVEESYSETTEFRDFILYYDGSAHYAPIDHTRKGFYCVKVTDVYGNVVSYLFRYADAAGIVITATYADGATAVYTGAHSGTVRSNNLLTVEVYGTGIEFLVNGTPTEGVLSKDKALLSFGTAGKYVVTVTDAAGIGSTFTLEIGTDPTFAAAESFLTGYNEKALLRAERYTNLPLNVVPSDAVAQVAVRFGESVDVVYDLLSEIPVNDPALRKACVGKLGDGIYEVCFRNQWGDLRTLTVNYRETPTLLLSRVTAFGGVPEPIPVSSALQNGFCSSNSVTFATEAARYAFTVNGEAVSLDEPLTYEFRSASGNGSFEYEITYTDAYGFEYCFTAVLLRQTVPIDLSGMTLIELDKTLYTTKDVVVTFPEGCVATVTSPGEDAREYTSGTRIRKDGTYRFTVVDVAGNVSTAVIVRDSVVGCIFTPASSADVPVLFGNVINDSAVFFRPLANDTAHILGVFFNGKEEKDWDSVRFAETGCWEILVGDDVGNTSYFMFYLLNHAVNHFDYEAPYGYTVTEVWWTDPDGNRQLTTLKGESISLTDDGDYAVIMVSPWDNMAVNFTVTVNTNPPEVTLVGCGEGETTARPVTLSGLSVGDTVEVFINGVLNSRTVIATSSDIPSFTAAGRYQVVVRNAAGTEVSFSFTHKYVTNTATSVLIIIACTAIATGVFIGLVYRNRSKIDE